MKYVKAQDVLPEEFIKILQEYADGKYLYIPKKHDAHMGWGEKSGIKNSLKERNTKIYEQYLKGKTINELAQEFFLSDKSIRRIITQERAKCS